MQPRSPRRADLCAGGRHPWDGYYVGEPGRLGSGAWAGCVPVFPGRMESEENYLRGGLKNAVTRVEND